jgi:outer membrane protein assembly factor BamB
MNSRMMTLVPAALAFGTFSWASAVEEPPQGTADVLPPSEVVALDIPKALAGIHDLRVMLYRRGASIHQAYALAPARDNMVHLVTWAPVGRKPLQFTEREIAGSLQVFVFSPAGNYATSCPHHVSGNDQLVLFEIEATVRAGAIEGRWKGSTQSWTASVGRPIPAEGNLTGRVSASIPAPLPADSLAEGAAWPSVLGPHANASAIDYGGRLLDSLSEARLVWVSEDKTTGGRTTKFGYLPNRTLSFYPMPGPYATPVVGKGLVFHYDSLPAECPSAPEEEGGDAAELKARGLNPQFFAKSHDHVVTASDASTGRTAWRVRFSGKGAGGGGKGGGAGGCCLADDVLICVGINGFANGFEPLTGKVLWADQIKGFNGSTAPMPIGGVAVCSLHGGGLTGVDPRTGRLLWKLDRASSRHSVALPWRHDGKDYAISLYSGDAQSPARLVCASASDGRLVWEHADVGANDVTMSLSGDILVTNGRQVGSTDVAKMAGEGQKNLPNLTAYRLTATGAQRLWELPPEHLLNTYGYSQPCVAGGLLIPPMHSQSIAVDLATGKIVHRGLAVSGGLTKSGHAGGGIGSTTSNGRVFTTGFTVRDAAAGAVLDVWRGPFAVGYLIPILPPIVDGRIFIRSHDAILCYDLREPDHLSKQTLVLELPAGLYGNASAVHAQLRLRNGRLCHGWLREGGALRSIETSRARWDGRELSGVLGVDSGWMLEDFEVKAALQGDTLSGAISTTVRGFAKPVAVKGAVTLAKRDAGWKPDWTHVLRLEQATLNWQGNPGQMYLMLSVDGERVVGMGGSGLGKAPLQTDFRKFRIEGGRLRGTVVGIFRPDLWISGLTESGAEQRVAASYDLDVDLTKEQDAGTHSGGWGLAWSTERPLTGRLLREAPGRNDGRINAREGRKEETR